MPKQVFYKIKLDKQLNLLRPAAWHFLSTPFEDITITNLTEKMGVLRTDFYYYFNDKDDILNEIIKNFDSMIKEVNSDPKIHDVLEIVLEKVLNVKGIKNRKWISNITSDVHPKSIAMIVDHLLLTYKSCDCPIEKRRINISTKIFRLITIINKFANKAITENEARELFNN